MYIRILSTIAYETEQPDQTVLMCRLAWAFIVRICPE